MNLEIILGLPRIRSTKVKNSQSTNEPMIKSLLLHFTDLPFYFKQLTASEENMGKPSEVEF